MNLPNKLTLIRIAMVPFFVAALLMESIPHRFLWAMIIFIVASITDMLDGNIARSRGLVTDFGKLMDPLADKILVISALVCFNSLGLLSAVVTIITVAREFLVTSLRLVAATSGKVIAADKLGKAKTVTQDIAVPLIMFRMALAEFGVAGGLLSALDILNLALVITMTVLTVWSGANYLWKNREIISDIK